MLGFAEAKPLAIQVKQIRIFRNRRIMLKDYTVMVCMGFESDKTTIYLKNINKIKFFMCLMGRNKGWP